MERRVLMGRIVAPHGVRGLVKIAAYTSAPEAIGSYGPLQDSAGTVVRLKVRGLVKGLVLAAVDGVATREAAEALKGRELYVSRAQLPEAGDEVYVADLVGLEVRTSDGARLGRIVAVQEFGAGPLLEVAPEGGGETVFVPFTEAAAPVVAPEAGFVTVELPKGLWPGDEGDEEP